MGEVRVGLRGEAADGKDANSLCEIRARIDWYVACLERARLVLPKPGVLVEAKAGYDHAMNRLLEYEADLAESESAKKVSRG